jgi:hypothetical protein
MVKHSNPRALLGSIIEEHGTHEAKVWRLFDKKIKQQSGEAYRNAIIKSWFTFNFRSLTAPHSDSTQADVGAAVTKLKRGLLEQTVPLIGKLLGDCTREDCAKAGGWLQLIAARLGPNQVVRDVLSERQLTEILPRETKTRQSKRTQHHAEGAPTT